MPLALADDSTGRVTREEYKEVVAVKTFWHSNDRPPPPLPERQQLSRSFLCIDLHLS